jgi:hypothetical protein
VEAHAAPRARPNDLRGNEAAIDLALFLSSSLPTGSGSGAANFGRFDFLEFSFWKNELVLRFGIDQFYLLPRGSRHMTDDSIQIAATSPAQRRAHGTMRDSLGNETV